MVLSNGRRPGKSQWLKGICGKTAAVPEMPILNDLHRARRKQCSVGCLCHANAILSWGRANTGRFVVVVQGRAHRNVDAVREAHCTVCEGEYVGNSEQIRVGAPRQRGRDSGGRLKSEGECRESRIEKRGGQSRLSNWRLWGLSSPVEVLAPPRARPRPFPPSPTTKVR